MGLGPVGPIRVAISDAVCEGRTRSPRDPSVRRSARDSVAATVRAPRAGSRHSAVGLVVRDAGVVGEFVHVAR